jgi:ABC-type transport system involved in cytochrome bd biosynthesis fused ATPase/permease subunit
LTQRNWQNSRRESLKRKDKRMRTLADFLFSAILNALWMTPLLVVAVEAGTRLFGQLRGHMLYRIWMASFFLALLLPMLPAISVHWPEREAAAVAVQPSGRRLKAM